MLQLVLKLRTFLTFFLKPILKLMLNLLQSNILVLKTWGMQMFWAGWLIWWLWVWNELKWGYWLLDRSEKSVLDIIFMLSSFLSGFSIVIFILPLYNLIFLPLLYSLLTFYHRMLKLFMLQSKNLLFVLLHLFFHLHHIMLSILIQLIGLP